MDIENIPGSQKQLIRFDNSIEATMVSSALVPRGSFINYIGFLLRDSKTLQSIMEITIGDTYPAAVEMTDRQLSKAYYALARDRARNLTGSLSVQHEVNGVMATIDHHLGNVE